MSNGVETTRNTRENSWGGGKGAVPYTRDSRDMIQRGERLENGLNSAKHEKTGENAPNKGVKRPGLCAQPLAPTAQHARPGTGGPVRGTQPPFLTDTKLNVCNSK